MRRQNVSLPLIITLALLGALVFMLVQWLLTGIPPVSGQEPALAWNAAGLGQRYIETIPVYDVRELGYQPLTIDNCQLPIANCLEWGGGSNPVNPYAVIRLNGSPLAYPGATARYEITLANYESVTHTYQLTGTLPAQLAYVPGSADGLIYNPATRSLTWQGELAPGHLEYVIEENSIALPYLDLADFGAVNLCDDFIANGEGCDDVTVTFNLGVNGYTANLYGELLSQLTVSANGLVLGSNPGDAADGGHNQWLPDTAVPGFLLAGLWRDVDMTTAGRWHAAIITGLVAGHDVFYAQWHDAPQANDPDLTARHAVAVVLNGNGGLDGQAFFVYDNISDPAQMAAAGYTIGIEDKLGARGTTYAYAPCCGDPQPPQGYPPAAGTTLHLRPVLFGADSAYRRTFGYTAIVNGQVPETIANTAVASSSSNDPALTYVWTTHYLAVRWQAFLPVAMRSED